MLFLFTGVSLDQAMFLPLEQTCFMETGVPFMRIAFITPEFVTACLVAFRQHAIFPEPGTEWFFVLRRNQEPEGSDMLSGIFIHTNLIPLELTPLLAMRNTFLSN